MSTMTITESTPVFSVQDLPTVNQAREFVESLTTILEKYKGWKDPLSKKLFTWGVEVISLDLEGDKFSPQSQERALIFADELARKILVNPLDNSPLTKPMLDGGFWVWDKSTLDDYRSLAPNAPSPFTNKPFDVTPHHFAWDVIEWTALFQMDGASDRKMEKFESKRATTKTEVVSTVEDSIEERASRVIEYQAKAFIFAMNQLTEQTKILKAAADEGAKTMEAFKVAQDKLSKQEAERAEGNAKAHLNNVNAMIAANEKVNAARVAVLDNNNKDLDTRLTKKTQELTITQKKVEDCESRIAAQDRTIAHLSGEVNHLRNADRRSSCIIS